MRERPVELKMLREPDGTFTAFLVYPNGVDAEVHAPTFRKMVNQLKSMGLDTSGLFEFQIGDGLGLLERALR